MAPSTTAAQKAARRSRFFAAISTQSRASATSKTHTSNEDDTQTATSAAAGPSTSPPSSLPPDITKKLTQISREQGSAVPSYADDEKARKEKLAIHSIMTTPPAQLPHELGALQRQVLEIDGPMKQMLDTPFQSLPPELQQFKRKIMAYFGEMLQRPNAFEDAQRRLNDFLRVNNEEAVQFGQIYQKYAAGDVGAAEKLSNEVKDRMVDLKRRKPHLSVAIDSLMAAQFSAKNAGLPTRQGAVGQL